MEILPNAARHKPVRPKQGYLLFLLLVLISSLWFFSKLPKSVTYHSTGPSAPETLPDFEISNINGGVVRDEDIDSSYVFIEFLNSSDPSDIDLLNAVASNWQLSNLTILAIESESRFPKSNIENDSGILVRARDPSRQLWSRFGLPMRSSSFFLFGPDRKLIIKGNSNEGYEKRIKIELTRALAGRVFSVSDISKEGSSLADWPWLRQLKDMIILGDKPYYLFALFTTLCASCQQDALVTDLNDLYLTKRHLLEISSIIYPKYLSQADLESLIEQAKIVYPVVLADSDLFERWDSLISSFNPGLLNDILILVDRKGTILKVHDVTCGCYGEFIKTIRAIEE